MDYHVVEEILPSGGELQQLGQLSEPIVVDP